MEALWKEWQPAKAQGLGLTGLNNDQHHAEVYLFEVPYRTITSNGDSNGRKLENETEHVKKSQGRRLQRLRCDHTKAEECGDWKTTQTAQQLSGDMAKEQLYG